MRLTDFLTEQTNKEDGLKLLVLTSKKDDGNSEDLYATAEKIKKLCKKKGIAHDTIFIEDAFIDRDGDAVRIHNADDPVGTEINSDNTAVIVRGSVGSTQSSMDILSQLERHNIFCVNTRKTMEECSDKYRTVIILADRGVPTPTSAFVTCEEALKGAFERVGGKFPCVLKTITGSKGIGVFMADSWAGMKSTLQTIWKINPETEILIQEYIDAKFDMRVHVLGNKVIAAMKRYKIEDDFRSNYSLGGKVEKLELTSEQEKIAIEAAKAVGGIWVGVDMMEEDGKLFVIEINSSPGTDGIEKATKKNITEMVVDYVVDKKNWIKSTTEVGFLEKVSIDGIGSIDAKMDIGNGSYCVIHAEDVKIDGDTVTWKFKGKKMKSKLETTKNFTVGGVRNSVESRPVVRLDITLGDTTYKNIRFTLSNRDDMTTPILLNRMIIRRAGLTINPQKRYVLGGDK